jgi:hypothetical protein
MIRKDTILPSPPCEAGKAIDDPAYKRPYPQASTIKSFVAPSHVFRIDLGESDMSGRLSSSRTRYSLTNRSVSQLLPVELNGTCQRLPMTSFNGSDDTLSVFIFRWEYERCILFPIPCWRRQYTWYAVRI